MSEKQKVDFREFLNVYEFKYVLPGSGEEVTFKPITTGQLKKLLTFGNNTDPIIVDEALDQLISSSVTSRGFDIKNIYLQDRFSLMVEIRKATKGNKYEFAYICKECKSQNFQSIDLNKLKTVKLPEKIQHKVKLTDSISIILDNIKRKEQISALKNLSYERMNDYQKYAEMAILTHAAGIQAIETPNGVQDNLTIDDKKYLIENIPTPSYDLIKQWFKKYDFGVDFTFNITCQCGYKENIEIPLENFFF